MPMPMIKPSFKKNVLRRAKQHTRLFRRNLKKAARHFAIAKRLRSKFRMAAFREMV